MTNSSEEKGRLSTHNIGTLFFPFDRSLPVPARGRFGERVRDNTRSTAPKTTKWHIGPKASQKHGRAGSQTTTRPKRICRWEHDLETGTRFLADVMTDVAHVRAHGLFPPHVPPRIHLDGEDQGLAQTVVLDGQELDVVEVGMQRALMEQSWRPAPASEELGPD